LYLSAIFRNLAIFLSAIEDRIKQDSEPAVLRAR